MDQLKTTPIKTVLLLVISSLILYLITNRDWIIVIGLSIGLIGLFSRKASEIIDSYWGKISWVLSLIIPNILLTIIFFFFLTPIAYLSKLFGKKNQLNIKNTKASLFIDHKKVIDKEYFEKPW